MLSASRQKAVEEQVISVFGMAKTSELVTLLKHIRSRNITSDEFIEGVKEHKRKFFENKERVGRAGKAWKKYAPPCPRCGKRLGLSTVNIHNEPTLQLVTNEKAMTLWLCTDECGFDAESSTTFEEYQEIFLKCTKRLRLKDDTNLFNYKE